LPKIPVLKSIPIFGSFQGIFLMYGRENFSFFEWFAGLSRPVRLTISSILVVLGWGVRDLAVSPRIWLFLCGLGFVLLMFSFDKE